MDAQNYLPTLDELINRLRKALYRNPGHTASGDAVGLHCWPRRHDGRDHWYAIGPVNWGNKADSWFDIRLPGDHYQTVNRLLADACEELRIRYLNMN
jgi:hypothetical protein